MVTLFCAHCGDVISRLIGRRHIGTCCDSCRVKTQEDLLRAKAQLMGRRAPPAPAEDASPPSGHSAFAVSGAA